MVRMLLSLVALTALVFTPVLGQPQPRPAQAKQPRPLAQPDLGRKISTLADGVVKTVKVETGAAVKAGDVLVELSNPAAELDARVSQVRMNIARAEFDATKTPTAEAELSFQNAKKLYEAKNLPLEKLRLAEFTLSRTKENLAIKEGAFQLAELEFQKARLTLDNLTIHAPVDGTVTAILYHPGEAVRAWDVVVRIRVGN